MAYVITNNCINCKACLIECLEDAIFIPTKKMFKNRLNKFYISADHYNIDQSKCSGCILLDRPRCADICPMDAIKEV